MSLKWNLFALCNFILLALYSVFILGLLRFSVEVSGSSVSFTFFAISLVIIFLNLLFNIYIVRKHAYNLPVSKNVTSFYRFSCFLFAVSFVVVIANFFSWVSSDLNSRQFDNSTYWILFMLLMQLVMGVYIFIIQVNIIKDLRKERERME